MDDFVIPNDHCNVGGSCTICWWDRIQKGLLVKPRKRRPKCFIAWKWRVIARQ
jgi:hypothetical protein